METMRETIIGLQRTSELNRLTKLDNGAVYDEPLVGVADGFDPLFFEYKTVIGEFHLTPWEVLEHASRDRSFLLLHGECSVICWSLPFT